MQQERSLMWARRPGTWPWRLGTMAGTVLALVTVVVPFEGTAAADAVVEIRVLSNRADLVSGGDALVEVVLPSRANLRQLTVDVDGRDVTDAFADHGGRLIGLVDGLEVGSNVLTASLPGGRGASVEITNHPRGGPLFAGPPIDPWSCDTSQYGLEPAVDDQCNTNVRFDLHYRSTVTSQFHRYDPDNPPDDLATTTTSDGVTVPYIVRVETGVMNRGGYKIAVLFDPDDPWSRFAPQDAWNRNVLIVFEGGCSIRHEQAPTKLSVSDGVLYDGALSRGLLVVASSLNITENHCHQWVSAETAVMLKEHVIEQYGDIRHTIGKGCSGGSTQQYHVASNYPGVLDGLIPGCSFPDLWAAVTAIEDCNRLQRHFDSTSAPLWANPAQQAAVAGHATVTTCRAFASTFSDIFFDPAHDPGCITGWFSADPDVVVGQVDWNYHPETNPTGVRCTIQDQVEAIWGHRLPSSWGPVEQAIDRGFAPRLYDNVGVQYGLEALRAGQILPEQFVDLNENVGGSDIDHTPRPERSVADPEALAIGYRVGAITDMAAVSLPIINIRPVGYEEFHPDAHSLATRARLDAAHGHHDNHVIWRELEPLTFGPGEAMAIGTLIDWLDAMEADERPVPYEQKVAENKPSDAVDRCLVDGVEFAKGADCHGTLPFFSFPRHTAGGPLAGNVVKCQLRALDRTDDYGLIPFTDDQWARLEAAFPTGVCDHSRPGVGVQPSIPWLDFTDGPGGTPLGPPPVAVPLERGPGMAAASVATPSPDALPATGGGAAAAGLLALTALFARLVRRPAGSST